VSFALRGVSLAAMDINLVGRNSSDPYFILYAVDAAGAKKNLGKSNTVKANLNPEWEVLEVSAEALAGAKLLKVEVRDHAMRPRTLTMIPTLALTPALALTLTLTLALTLTRCGTGTWARRVMTSSARRASSYPTCRQSAISNQ